ncbi:hypothetical protein [Pseudanabaena sp. ABRG5-3]|uniref:hypothetical protein n=1 Tax=Pseudanabaena sp. ABRG5-3 TaxID=685565 RepID=UPI000DC6E7B6|nr:hypothetical protein [Pseudanabaena sp. ABRG5-3]BBC26063.1 hypothetical protein ABRG53_3806 [Pseudanabaena sp. ABRG5-3]
MNFSKYLAPVGIVAVMASAAVVASPNDASAYHKTNKWERRANLENGWVVFYSKEISHAEELKIAAALIADATVSGGGATAAYFANFASESLSQLLSEARKKSPQTFQAFKNNLTHKKLLSSIRTSFRSGEIKMNIAGLTVAVGKETYNRAECLKVFGKERCTSTPNTFQPYIRIKK